MQYLKLKDIQKAPESFAGPITVCGWVRTVREGKAFGFIELNDGTSFRPVQIVYANDERKLGKGLSTGCAIVVDGELVLTPDAPQPFEIHANAIAIEGDCPPDYPMQKKRHTLEYLRTMQTLRPRTNTFLATFRVRSVVAAAIHEFFQERGFVYVHTPILTNADCEGRGEMFQVTTLDLENLPRTEDGKVDYSQDFFKKPVHLSGSGQLYGEAFALAFRDIYTFGPTFRAEYSFTARHASEFWMIEPEMAFCDLEGDMDVAEAMVKYIIQTVLDRCPEEMAFFNKFVDKGLLERLDNVLNNEFKRLTYTEAIEILKNSGEQFEYPVEWGVDLQSEHERYITEKVFGKPVFLTDYPKEIKSFYMRQNDDGKTVAAADCRHLLLANAFEKRAVVAVWASRCGEGCVCLPRDLEAGAHLARDKPFQDVLVLLAQHGASGVAEASVATHPHGRSAQYLALQPWQPVRRRRVHILLSK